MDALNDLSFPLEVVVTPEVLGATLLKFSVECEKDPERMNKLGLGLVFYSMILEMTKEREGSS